MKTKTPNEKISNIAYAKAAGLRYVSYVAPGISRRKRGK
jgi:hypothetical protein